MLKNSTNSIVWFIGFFHIFIWIYQISFLVGENYFAVGHQLDRITHGKTGLVLRITYKNKGPIFL